MSRQQLQSLKPLGQHDSREASSTFNPLQASSGVKPKSVHESRLKQEEASKRMAAAKKRANNAGRAVVQKLLNAQKKSNRLRTTGFREASRLPTYNIGSRGINPATSTPITQTNRVARYQASQEQLQLQLQKRELELQRQSKLQKGKKISNIDQQISDIDRRLRELSTQLLNLSHDFGSSPEVNLSGINWSNLQANVEEQRTDARRRSSNSAAASGSNIISKAMEILRIHFSHYMGLVLSRANSSIPLSYPDILKINDFYRFTPDKNSGLFAGKLVLFPSDTDIPTLIDNLINEDQLIGILSLYTLLSEKEIDPPLTRIERTETMEIFNNRYYIRFFIDLLEYQFYIFYLIAQKLSQINSNNGNPILILRRTFDTSLYEKINKIMYLYQPRLYIFLKHYFNTNESTRDASGYVGLITEPQQTNNRAIFVKKYKTETDYDLVTLFTFPSSLLGKLNFKSKFIHVYNILFTINNVNIDENDPDILRIRRFNRTPEEIEAEREAIRLQNEEEERKMSEAEAARKKSEENAEEAERKGRLKEFYKTTLNSINDYYKKYKTAADPLYENFKVPPANRRKTPTKREEFRQKPAKELLKKLINNDLLLEILNNYPQLEYNNIMKDLFKNNTLNRNNTKYDTYFFNALKLFIELLEYQFFIYTLIMQKLSEKDCNQGSVDPFGCIPFHLTEENWFIYLALTIYVFNQPLFEFIKNNFSTYFNLKQENRPPPGQEQELNESKKILFIKNKENKILFFNINIRESDKEKFKYVYNTIKAINEINTNNATLENQKAGLEAFKKELFEPDDFETFNILYNILFDETKGILPPEIKNSNGTNLNFNQIRLKDFFESLINSNPENYISNDLKITYKSAILYISYITYPKHVSLFTTKVINQNEEIEKAVLEKMLLNILHLIYFYIKYFLFGRRSNGNYMIMYGSDKKTNAKKRIKDANRRIKIAKDLFETYYFILRGTQPMVLGGNIQQIYYIPETVIQDYRNKKDEEDESIREHNIIYALNKSFYTLVQDYIDYIDLPSSNLQTIGAIIEMNRLRFEMYQMFINFGLVNEEDMNDFVNSAIPNYLKNNRNQTKEILEAIRNTFINVPQYSRRVSKENIDAIMAKYQSYIDNLSKVGHRNIIKKRYKSNPEEESYGEYLRMHKSLYNTLERNFGNI